MTKRSLSIIVSVLLVAVIAFLALRTKTPTAPAGGEKVLSVIAGDVQMNKGGTCWGNGKDTYWIHSCMYHKGLRFFGFDKGNVSLFYLKDRNEYRIYGKAKVCYPDGRVEVVEDEIIRAPGSPNLEGPQAEPDFSIPANYSSVR